MVRGIFVAVGILACTPCFAQQTPKQTNDPLMEICSGFLDQTGQGISGDRNNLCTCLVRETKARLTRQEMQIYNEAGQTGKQVPDAIMQKVIGIATVCLQQSAR